MADGLSAATCAIYAVLTLPVLYLLFKHLRHGAQGWAYLFVFCGLRVVGSGMAVSSTSSAASVISNIGLSPLLLATAGILHEARLYRIRDVDRKLEWLMQLGFHMIVVIGLALTAAGSAKLQKQQQPIDKAQSIVKAGISFLTVSWAVLVGWTALSFKAPRASYAHRAGTVLLSSVGFSLIFIGIRVFYSLASLVSQDPSLNPATGSLAIRVFLSFLSETIALLAYIAAGFLTQSGGKPDVEETHVEIPSSPKPSPPPYGA